MGIETGIVQRCGVAVAALALLAPTTTGAAAQAENPLVGNIACLSDGQRTELVRREMVEFLGAGKELIRNKREARDALSARDAAAAALEGCEQASRTGPNASRCDEERERLAGAIDEAKRAQAGQERAKAEFPAVASARIQAVRAEYPSCDSR